MIVAITVSTNYIDLLPFVYERNKGCFKHWVFVTDKNDHQTIKFLSNKPNVTVLYWDFQNERRHFDKGGAVHHAQYYVYDKFPDDWYLLIDTDIVLPSDTQITLLRDLPAFEKDSPLNSKYLIGIDNLMAFSKMSDLLTETNYQRWNNLPVVIGYFQLYKEKFFYSASINASRCDLDFCKFFEKSMSATRLKCYHLGKRGVHWKGTRTPGSDFVMDVEVHG
jgi:hypothetical protein